MIRGRWLGRLALLSDAGHVYMDVYALALRYATLRVAAYLPMIGTGNCFDKVPMESFIGTLKVEWTDPFVYPTRQQLHHDLFDFIEVFYNRTRLHSALGYLSPVAFEEGYYLSQPDTEIANAPPTP